MRQFVLRAAGLLALAWVACGAAAAQTVPLVRYQSKGGVAAYAAAPAHRKLYESNPSVWKEFGVVGHVYASKRPGAVPLLDLKRPTKFGDEHFYTTDIDEAVAVQKSDPLWAVGDFNKGVVGYVPASPQAGVTAAAYRYRQPSGRYYIYAFGEAENNLLKKSPELKFERVAFHFYPQPISGATSSPWPDAQPPAAQKPDLSVGAVSVMPNGKVIFAVRNSGFAVNKRPFDVRLTAYDGAGRALWSQDKTITPVIANNSSSEHSIEAPAGRTLHGVRVRVTADAGGAIQETDEGNNTSDFVNGLPALNLPGPVIKPPRPSRPAPGRDEQGQAGGDDLALRPALYANGAEAAKVNTASRYASPDRPLTLKRAEAVSCDGDVCVFNLGFFVQRSAADRALATYALLSGSTFGSVGNTVSFAAGERSKGVVHAVKLKPGENRIKVEVDPYREARDPNPANNGFEVTVVVEP